MTTPTSTSARQRHLALAAAFLGWMFAGFQFSSYILITRHAILSMAEPAALESPEGMQQVERDAKVWLSWYQAAFLLGAAIGGWLFGWLGDRIGRAKGLAYSILTYSLVAGLGYFATTPEDLLGAASRMKLAVNLVLGLNRAALAEGLAFAQAIGLDPRLALDVLRVGAAYSRVMDAKGEKMLARDFTPEARLAQHHKDVRLIVAEAARRGLKLPLTEAHDRLLEAAERVGHAASDNRAVIAAYDRP